MSYEVTVTYIDGTTETWDYINEVQLVDAVALRLHQKRRGYDSAHDFFVGIPLAAIRKWESAS